MSRKRMNDEVTDSDEDLELLEELRELARGRPSTDAPAAETATPSAAAKTTPAKKKTRKEKATPSKDASGDDDDDDDGEGDNEWGTRRGKKAKRGRGKARRTKAASDESDADIDGEEDEEAEEDDAPSKRASRSKAPASRGKARTTAAVPEDEFEDGYGADLMGNEEDRARLMAMTMREREEILAERQERRDALLQRRELLRRVENATKSQDASPSRATGRRTVSSDKERKTSRLKELKAKRAAAGKRDSGISSEEEEDDVSGSGSDASSDDHFIDSDDDDATTKRSSRSRFSRSSKADEKEEGEAEEPIVLSDAQACQLRRDDLARWALWENLEQIVTGTFVRVNVSPREGLPMYRLAQVEGLAEASRVYHLGNIPVKQSLTLRIGQSKRVFRFEFVSNTTLQEPEFAQYQKTLAAVKAELPTKSACKIARENLEKARAHVLSEAEVAQIIEKRQVLEPSKNYYSRRRELYEQKDVAVQSGNKDDIDRIEGELRSLEEEFGRYKIDRDNSLETVRKINQKNRQLQAAAEQTYLEKQKERAASGVQIDAAFKRRQFRAVPDTAAAPPAEPVAVPEEKKTVKEEESKVPAALSAAPPAPVDIFAEHSLFDIDIKLDAASAPLPVVSSSILGTTTASRGTPTGPAKRTLDLSAYKQSKGLL